MPTDTLASVSSSRIVLALGFGWVSCTGRPSRACLVALLSGTSKPISSHRLWPDFRLRLLQHYAYSTVSYPHHHSRRDRGRAAQTSLCTMFHQGCPTSTTLACSPRPADLPPTTPPRRPSPRRPTTTARSRIQTRRLPTKLQRGRAELISEEPQPGLGPPAFL